MVYNRVQLFARKFETFPKADFGLRNVVCHVCVITPREPPTNIWAIEVSKSDLPRFETWIDIFDLRNLRLLSVIFCAYRDVSDAT